MAQSTPTDQEPLTESEQVFELAAELFRVMSAPMRLKIISSLCNGEKNVGQLLEEINTTQPNMSQHLNTLYQAGVLGRRREGVQIYYRIINDAWSPCAVQCVPKSPSTGNEPMGADRVLRPYCPHAPKRLSLKPPGVSALKIPLCGV